MIFKRESFALEFPNYNCIKFNEDGLTEKYVQLQGGASLMRFWFWIQWFENFLQNLQAIYKIVLYLEKKLQWCQMHILLAAIWSALLASIPITLTPVLLVMMAQKFRHYSNFWEVYPTMPACPSLKTWKYVRLANNLVDAATAKIKFQEGCHPLLKSGNFWKKPRIKGRSGGWCFQSCCCKSFLTIHRRCYVCLLMKILGSRLQAKSSVVTNENCENKLPIIASFLVRNSKFSPFWANKCVSICQKTAK